VDQPVNGVPVDVVSIAELRADASRISRAFVAVGLLPVLFLLMILRDLQLPAWMATLFGAASLGVGLSLAHQGQDFTAGTLKSAVWVFGVFMALTAVCALALIAAIVSSASERNRPDALGKTRSSYPPAPDQGRVSGQPPAVHSRCRAQPIRAFHGQRE
jgi:hypothetical protein